MMIFSKLNIREQQHEYFHLLVQLYPELTKEKFDTLIDQMLESGYSMLGLYDHNQLVAIAGFAIHFNLYEGKHLYLYDLVCDENLRSNGYGRQMIEQLQQVALEANCERIVLCSKFERVDAIRFYTEKLDFAKTKYVIERMIKKVEMK